MYIISVDVEPLVGITEIGRGSGVLDRLKIRVAWLVMGHEKACMYMA